MSRRPIQAIYFFRADMVTPFRAVYGRIGRSSKYSKDFHQCADKIARALERSFNLQEKGTADLTWVWPGEVRTGGKYYPAEGPRGELSWPFDAAPDVWQLTPNPTEHTLQSITGQPGLKSEARAEAEFQRDSNARERPWFVAVHLHGDGPVLHARTVLERPDPGHEFASWITLPEGVRAAMQATRRSGDAGGVVEFEKGGAVPTGKLVRNILSAFEDNQNVLLVGPPGTGKTVAMEAVRAMYDGKPMDSVFLDTDRVHGAFGVIPADFTGDQDVRSLVFHPSYAYEHFVMGLLPDLVDGQVVVRPHVGPLLEMAHFASGPNRRSLLILDEFNRASASAVFGDTLALLDSDKRADPNRPNTGSRISTPYAHLEPETESGSKLPAEISLPSTLRILAAMNSADRSVAPLDAALRRRFSIIYVGPDYEVLEEHLGIADDFDPGDTGSWTDVQHINSLAVAILRAINHRIEMIEGRDFLLGQSVFWKVGGETRQQALESLATALDNRVIGTLLLTFTDNDDALAAVLGVGDEAAGKNAATWIDPDPAIAGVATRRLRPTPFQELVEVDLIEALRSLL